MQWKVLYYSCEAHEHSGVAVSVPGSAPYTYHIAECYGGASPDPDFRDMDPTDYSLEVFEGGTEYTIFGIAAGVVATPNFTTNAFAISLDIPTGTPVYVSMDYDGSAAYRPTFPLRNRGIYYAIRVDSTHCKLAYTYAEALAGTFIPLESVPTSTGGNVYLQVIAPTTGTYFAGTTGIFVFAAADAAKNLTLKYIYTLYS
jgi:hypothetical protein